MRQSVRKWLYSAGAVAAVGASVLSQGGMAAASPDAPAVNVARTVSAAQAASTAGMASTAGTVSAAKAASASAPKKWVSPRKYLVEGDHGAAVRSIQLRLKQLKYYPGPVNGVLGLDTLEAIWAFKVVQHLPVNNANQTEISHVTERAMEHPKLPKVLVPRGGSNLRIEVNQSTQVLVLYKHNKIELISHVSTGGGYYFCVPNDPGDCGYAVTPDGNYRAHWFAPGWVQVPLGEMYNPVFFIGGAYAIHGDIPVPWYPASHGCVRIPMDIATWFHTLIHVSETHGTPIYIRGKAPYYL